MSAFKRPSAEAVGLEAQLRWWRLEVERRRALRQERLQRGRLSPYLAAQDARMESAVEHSLQELLQKTAITKLVAGGQ